MSKQTVILAVDANCSNPHVTALPSVIESDDLKVVIHSSPVLNFNERGADFNFDFILGGPHSAIMEYLPAHRAIIHTWPNKDVQAIVLSRVIDGVNSSLASITRMRKVATFFTADRHGIETIKPAATELLHHVPKIPASIKEVWLKPYDGAMGGYHLSVKSEFLYDLLLLNANIEVSNRHEHVKFSNNWFSNNHRPSNYIRIDEVKLAKATQSTEPPSTCSGDVKFFEPRAHWIIQEKIENIAQELRVLYNGKTILVRERTRQTSDGGLIQANWITDESQPITSPRMKYQTLQEWSSREVDLDLQYISIEAEATIKYFIEQLAKESKLTYFCADIFITTDGELGCFEYSPHFGIDATDPRLVHEFIRENILMEIRNRLPLL